MNRCKELKKIFGSPWVVEKLMTQATPFFPPLFMENGWLKIPEVVSHLPALRFLPWDNRLYQMMQKRRFAWDRVIHEPSGTTNLSYLALGMEADPDKKRLEMALDFTPLPNTCAYCIRHGLQGQIPSLLAIYQYPLMAREPNYHQSLIDDINCELFGFPIMVQARLAFLLKKHDIHMLFGLYALMIQQFYKPKHVFWTVLTLVTPDVAFMMIQYVITGEYGTAWYDEKFKNLAIL